MSAHPAGADGHPTPSTLDILLAARPGGETDAVAAALRRRGYRLHMAPSAEAAVSLLENQPPHLVIAILPLGEATCAHLAERALDPHAPVPLVLGGADSLVQGPVDAFELGAAEYCAAPAEDLPRLLFSVGVLLGARRGDLQLKYLQGREQDLAEAQELVADSPSMKRVMTVARLMCQRTARGGPASILISGEPGTGKRALARWIHRNSARRNFTFVDVAVERVARGRMEAELFGPRAGKAGLFQTADGGTLYLDEVGRLTLEEQTRLLAALEERQVHPGGGHPVQVDVQFIAATQLDLKAMVAAGTFREDLLRRLSALSLQLPPLRDRGRDTLLLAESFARARAARDGERPCSVAADAAAWLTTQRWPGNLRELRASVERAATRCEGGVIHAPDLHAPGQPRVSVGRASEGLEVALPAEGLDLEVLEREVIRLSLERCEGNVSKTARFLSISRQTLIYRMKKHGLRRPGAPVARPPSGQATH
ncbi:MAG TPA: sigma 54-interacting transcriptional regulator [Myxococcaceae bacterium]|nr:sigma 54-interacting transcriptional regulator [Myxococcaceae bacterium]